MRDFFHVLSKATGWLRKMKAAMLLVTVLMLMPSRAWADDDIPFGYIGYAQPYPGSIHIMGWCIQDTDTAARLKVEVDLRDHNGIFHGLNIGQTNKYREDPTFPKRSGYHAFDTIIALSSFGISLTQETTYTLFVYVFNRIPGGQNPLMQFDYISPMPCEAPITLKPPYKISFNANDGINAPSAQNKSYHFPITLSAAKPTRTGYTFLGWNTVSNGTGSFYVSGANYAAEGDATLYAQWAPVPVINSGEFQQANNRIELKWNNTELSGFLPGNWVIYRNGMKIAAIPSSAQRIYHDTGFPYESEQKYQIYFVPGGMTDDTRMAELASGEYTVSSRRKVKVDNLAHTLTADGLGIVFTWNTDGYPMSANHQFVIYADNDSLCTIRPEDYQTNIRWEHRSVNHSSRVNGRTNDVWWTEEPIDFCSPHTYTVQGRIGSAVLNTGQCQNVAVAIGTEIETLTVSKGDYTDKVRLAWTVNLHGSNKAKKYMVQRRLIPSSDSNWEKVKESSGAAGQTYFTYEDTDPNPGLYYEYQVTMVDLCDDKREYHTTATDIGFIRSTGTVSGRITYGSSGAVAGVTVKAERNDGKRLHALRLMKDNSLIHWAYPANDTTYAKRIFGNAFSMQLWVYADQIGATGNTIADLGQWALGWTKDTSLCIRTETDTVCFDALKMPVQTYSHITLTRSGSTLTAYIVRTQANGEPLIQSQSIVKNLPEVKAKAMTIGGFRGYVDDYRLWTRALAEQEILFNYDQVMAGDEINLETYWNFDEGLEDYSYDVSRHEHHCRHKTDIESSDFTPGVLQFKSKTDADGNYTITGLPFLTSKDAYYKITPSLGTHTFRLTYETRLIDREHPYQDKVNFIDESSFPVSGKVLYAGTDYPVEGCTFYIDAATDPCSDGNKPITSDAHGEFTISVPIGEHYIRIVKDGHRFSNDGRSARYAFIDPMQNLTFYDSTLVNLTGRVVGGNIEGAKPVGFGLSKNNIGVAMLRLRLQNDAYRLNVVEQKNEAVVSYSANLSESPLTNACPEYMRTSQAWRGASYNSNCLYIRTDSATGEFSAMVPPLMYIVDSIYVMATGQKILEASLTLDMTNPKVAHVDSIPKDTTNTRYNYYSYHTLLKRIYHTEPVFTVRQSGHSDGSFGIDTFTVKDVQGVVEVRDIHVKQPDGTIRYNYGGAIFISLDKYLFEMEGYEQFVNMDKNTPVVSRVPLVNTPVTAKNAMAVSSSEVKLRLDTVGKASYEWQAGLPLPASPYTRTLQITYGEDDRQTTALELDGIVLGVYPIGNNFVTAGPIDIDMILRDPPGSNSYTTWTKGKVTTYKTVSTYVDTKDTTETVSASFIPTISLGLNISGGSIGGEVGGGVHLGSDWTNTWEVTSSNTYSKTVSISEAFYTSDSPEYDGADGDIFIGTSTNIIIGDVRKVSLYRDSTDMNKASIYVKDNYAQGLSFPTAFAYTQHQILHSIIPDLENIHRSVADSVLITVPDVKTAVNNTNHLLYVTEKSRNDAHFGDSATYTILPPENATQKMYVDTLSSLRMQIKAWKDVLACNEKEKVQAAENRQKLLSSGKMVNRSFDAGTSVTQTTTVEQDTTIAKETYHNYYGVAESISGGFSVFGLGFQKGTTSHDGSTKDNKTETDTVQNATFSYTLRDNDPGDVISVDVYTDQGLYGSPIFHTRAGKTSNPYEGEVKTAYYKPGTTIMDATLQIERPDIGVVKPIVNDIPSSSAVNYELHLANISDAGEDCTFRLMVADESNPYGAQLIIDGRPITDNTRLITIPYGQTIVKTLQLKQSDLSILHYENIAIILASQVQSDPTSNMAIIADTVRISAHFVPSASPVTLALNMSTMNTQTGTDLVVTMKDFDRAYYHQKAFRFQYKPQGGDWTTFHEYVLNAEDMTSQTEMLPAEGAAISYTLPMKDYSAGLYRFRIVSVSTFGTDEIYLNSNELELTKNLNRPRPLGLTEPADGILDIGDELSITFNEEFVSGELTKTRNFLITGVLNGAPIEHQVALRLYENALAAQTEASVSFSNKDFSIDMWVNIHSDGLLLSHGTAKDLQVSTDAQGHLMIQIEESTLVSESVLPHDKWIFLTLSYHHDAEQGLLNASVAYDDVTEQLFQNRLVPLYKDRGPLFVGGGAAGAIHELLLWDEAHDIASALAQRSVTKNPATPHLIGYWKMNEGEGRTIRDYSRNRHMNTTDANWYLNNVNKALMLDGTHHFAAYTGNVPPMPTDDYAAELWFKAGKQNGEAQLFQLGEVGLYLDTLGKLHLQSGANDQIINHKFEILNNSWHHVLLNVHRLGTAAVYIDGERALTVSADKIGDLASDSLCIGPFQGAVDEIRLWQATLQSDMLASNRKQRLRGDEPGLSLYYPFEKKSLDEYNQVIVSGTMEEFTGHGEEAVISGQPSAISYSDEAPALKEKPTETNVAFSFTASNTKIVIDIDEDPARIEGCMLNITVRDVRSNTGNYSLPATWTAFVHRNELAWTDDELSTITNNQSPITNNQLSTALINRSGTPQRWTLSKLPAWLTVNATSGMLNPLQQQSLAFRVSASAPIGKHELTVYAMGNNGIETPLTLHITITGNLPDWTVNPADYENSMSVIAQLDFFGEISEDEDDIVAAFIGDECRGIAQPEYKERYDAYYLTMIIYGDSTTDNKTVSFRAYKASTGVIYTQVTPSDSIRSKALSFVGSYKEPVMLSVQDRIEQRLALRQGWNWISLSVKADDMRPQAILQDIENDVIAIKGHQDETQGIDVGFMTHTDTGWVGYMEPLLNRRSYMIKTKRDCELRIVGTSVEPATHTVRIHANWGWPGYFGQQRIALADAFADADPQHGDIVRTQRAAAYYDDYEWVGSLQALEPGQGYAYYSVTNEEKWFAYPSSSVAAAPRRNEKMRKYENEEIVNDFAYPYNMILVGQVLYDREPAANARIAVFDGDECRSVGYTDADGNLLMLVAGEDEATLSYKLMLNGQVFETVETLHYVTDAIVGTPDSPHFIRFGEGQGIGNVQVDDVQCTKVLRDGILFIERNGVEYNANGMMVK